MLSTLAIKHRYHALAWAMCCASLLAGCYTLQRVMVKRLVMGRLALPGVRNLTVGPVTGSQGMLVQPMLVEKLKQLNFFYVADARHAGLTLNRFGLAVGTDFADTDAVVTGSVDDPVYSETFDIDQSEGAHGQLLTTYVRHPHVLLRAHFRVIDPVEQEILGTATLLAEAEGTADTVTVEGAPYTDARYVSGLFGAADLAPALTAASEQLALRFASEVRVRQVPTYVSLYHDEKVEQSATALAHAQQGDWNPAISLYSQLVERAELLDPSRNDSHCAQAHYNYGVALAYAGYFNAGVAELEMAYAMNHDQKILAELKRVHQFAIGL